MTNTNLGAGAHHAITYFCFNNDWQTNLYGTLPPPTGLDAPRSDFPELLFAIFYKQTNKQSNTYFAIGH